MMIMWIVGMGTGIFMWGWDGDEIMGTGWGKSTRTGGDRKN